MKIFIIGVSHNYQLTLRTGLGASSNELTERIIQASKCFNIKTIAEAVGSATEDGQHSSCVQAATQLNIEHIFYGMDRFNLGTPARSSEQSRFIAEQLEIAWISGITNAEYPMLFVCDDSQVDSFAKKCKNKTMKVMLLDRSWEPPNGHCQQYEKRAG